MEDYTKVALMVRTAKLYYEEGLGQAEIAKKLEISRSYVSKLINDAKEQNIVSISVKDPINTESMLERTIRQHYGLRKVIVANSSLEENAAAVVAREAAKLLSVIVKSGDVIGLGWGRTMYMVTKQLTMRHDLSKVRVVSLYGQQSIMSQNVFNTDGLSLISEAFQATTYMLTAPVFMSSAKLKDRFYEEKSIGKVLDCISKVNIAVFTIGNMKRASFIDQPGGLSDEEVRQLLAQDAVGDVCLHFIDSRGKLCNPEIDSRTVSVPFDELLHKDYRVAVVSGRVKTGAVYAALEGGIINVLVCDEDIAKDVIERIHEKEERNAQS